VRPYRLCKPTFLNGYVQLTPRERWKIKQIISEIRQDPTPDDIKKIPIPYLGSMYVKAYDDDDFWVLYYVEQGIVCCVSCGRDSSYIDILEDLVVSRPPDPN
jgi:hypothetical protein